jgi:imidazolonepropionase-like amidohydrolase
VRWSTLTLLAIFATVTDGQVTRSIAITHVAVADVAGGVILPDHMVVITGDRIESVQASSDSVPEGAQRIDGRGKFVIPGLWDNHVHLSYARSSALPTLVANGVTYVRDLGSRLAEIDEWRGQIAAERLVGPLIVRAGPILNGRESNRYQLAITNAVDANAAVRALEKTGVDLIKVHRRTPRDAYFAVVEETRRRSLPLAGHIPMTVQPIEASNAGQQTIEHAVTLFEGTFSESVSEGALPEAIRTWRNSAAAQNLFAAFVRNDTVVDPTLVTERRLVAWLENPNDPRDRFLAASAIRESADYLRPVRDDARKQLVQHRALLSELEAAVGQMHRAGVNLITGTDLSFTLMHPGFSLHDELQALVDVGLTPAEALRAATLNPSKLFPRLDAGVVAAGKRANLVLLNGNPIADIRNVRRIHAVVLAGRVYDRALLDRLLADAALAAANQ